MTRYDPFAYGEVRLEHGKAAPDPSNPADATQDAEDVLFSGGEDVKQAPPADSSWSLLEEDVDDLMPGAEASAQAAQDAEDFGADVLGEEVAGRNPYLEGAGRGLEDFAGAADEPEAALPDVMAAPEPEQAPPRAKVKAKAKAPAPAPEPVAEDAVEPAAEPGDERPEPARRAREVGRRRLRPAAAPLPAEAADEAAASAKPKAKGKRRGRPMAAAALPLLICGGGGTASAWFWVLQQNPVMGGILGAATLVSALFAWLLLRG